MGNTYFRGYSQKEEQMLLTKADEDIIRNRSLLLVQHGFIKPDKKSQYKLNTETGLYEPLGEKIDPNDANEEILETLPGSYVKTGYPKSAKTQKILWENYDMSIEEPYFWVLDVFRDNIPNVIKLEDSFAAAENSAIFGHTQQRLGAQQDRVSQLLATTGKMIKELFQMLRELRIIDERLAYYDEADDEIAEKEHKNTGEKRRKPLGDRKKGGEITLKGIFVDLVQGGGKSPGSVYGMSQSLEYITLPDLFFDAPPFANTDELEEHIKRLGKDFNQNVLRVLLRHLRQYMEWKKMTSKEHHNRKDFLLKYLTQHFEIIKMYLQWLKPYLRNTGKLSFKEKNMDSPDLISAFDGSMLDIEILGHGLKSPILFPAYPVVIATFQYKTRAELKTQAEGYNRGPIHIGRVEIYLRAYGWTQEQIDQYQRLKDRETMLFLGSVAGPVISAMDELKPLLDKYLAEAKGIKEKTKGTNSKAPRKKSLIEKMFGDFYTSSSKQHKPKTAKQLAREHAELEIKLEDAARVAMITTWNSHHNFKKSHRMTAW